ncbi:uncharacterized protein KY384_005459 [Bacidia gigantensis]|uniref:uncharacterized protein n=1 Tax=Bacidia gigantensis TaxID=2732470 RepID=UPI001D037D79|nr:uncharacterized protein KY384_005459 [Bacidia gigantensis]KAG8529977.1 hypothetical protein KY384_005459 [Bacidia gigantensis]
MGAKTPQDNTPRLTPSPNVMPQNQPAQIGNPPFQHMSIGALAILGSGRYSVLDYGLLTMPIVIRHGNDSQHTGIPGHQELHPTVMIFSINETFQGFVAGIQAALPGMVLRNIFMTTGISSPLIVTTSNLTAVLRLAKEGGGKCFLWIEHDVTPMLGDMQNIPRAPRVQPEPKEQQD